MAKRKKKDETEEETVVEVKEEKKEVVDLEAFKKEMTQYVDSKVDVNAIKNEVTSYVNNQIDLKVQKSLDDKFYKEVMVEVRRANKRVIRHKNLLIFFSFLFNLLFLVIIGLLIGILYKNNYFDSYIDKLTKNIKKNEVVEKPETKKKEEVIEVVEPTLDELKEKYGMYLDSYSLSSSSIYVEDFYQGKLTDELLNYFALSSVNFEKLEVEEDYNTFGFDTLEKSCSLLFDTSCAKKNFDYNGNKIRYFQKLDSFVTNSLLEKEEKPSITREIIDIKENKDDIVITTLEGVVSDGILYSVQPNKIVDESYGGKSFTEYEEQLNKIVYTFHNKKLVSIQKG